MSVASVPQNSIQTAPRRLRSLALPLLAAFAGGLGASVYLRGPFQRSRMFLPDRYPNGTWDPAAEGLEAEDCWFSTDDGVRLHGWWMPQDQAECTVLYYHGNSGSIGLRLDVFRVLRALPINLFAFDYRGYGRSAGSPSVAGLVQDARAAYDYLVRHHGQRADQLFLFGHSMGGALAVETALARLSSGVVVESAFTSIRDMTRARYPKLPLHLVARDYFRNIDKVPHMPVPKLFIHGTGDTVVPFQQGRQLYERALAPKSFYSVAEADHNDLHLLGGEGYRRALMEFFHSSMS